MQRKQTFAFSQQTGTIMPTGLSLNSNDAAEYTVGTRYFLANSKANAEYARPRKQNFVINEDKMAIVINKSRMALIPNKSPPVVLGGDVPKDEKLHALVQTAATSAELLTFFDQQTKRLIIQLSFGFASLLSLGGVALLIAGSSFIGGLGLIGFGSATLGSLFTYITGGQVKLKDYADAARTLPGRIIGKKTTEEGGKENE